jgi:hypothetical protein
MHWKPRNTLEIRVDRTTLLTKKTQEMVEPFPVSSSILTKPQPSGCQAGDQTVVQSLHSNISHSLVWCRERSDRFTAMSRIGLLDQVLLNQAFLEPVFCFS